MVISSLTRGGSERRMLELIKGLKKSENNIDICLVSLFDIVEYTYVYDLPVKFLVLDKRRNKYFKLVLKLREIIKSYNPDIIHTWDFSSSMYITLANIFIKKNIINGFIASAGTNLNFFDRGYLYVKLLSPFCNIIVSNSKAGLKAYNISTRKGRCIYNGVDFSRFQKLLPPKDVEFLLFGEPKGEKFISVMVAAFEERKDYKTMLEAAIKLSIANPNAIFFFVGSGTNFSIIRKATPNELIDRQIFFLGRRNDVESILQICDVGLLISNDAVHGEGISNSIIEYMASGMPVIATKGGGTAEIVLNGITGFLIDPKDANQIVETIQLLMNDSNLRKIMGTNGIKFVHSQFDLVTKTKEYLELYKELLKY